MSVLVVGLVSINTAEQDALAKYLRVTTPLLEKVEAKMKQHFQIAETVIGDPIAESVMVVEYPSLEAMDGVFGSDEYKAVILYRDRAFRTYNVSVVSS